MDKSIVIEPVKNAVDIESTRNKIDVSLVKVESIYGFTAPVQIAVERKEVL